MIKLTDIIFYWLAWIILPVILEIIPSIKNFFILMYKKAFKVNYMKYGIAFKPAISILVPVYNSESTLYRCLESIYKSTYPNSSIEVILVDNGSKDGSYQEFQRAQVEFSDLAMWWMDSHQGKSRALNKAIFNSNGTYIINIDSDGILEEHALYNVVRHFETHSEVNCMTGAILIEPALIEKTEGFFIKQFRRMEFLEYAQSFLAGRNFESQTSGVNTIAGAFSAFRRSTLLKTFLYNTNTICEDTHLSFQISKNLHEKIVLCPDAIFMVDPIENLNKFYTQRQRWQIGELEVVSMFMKKNMRLPIIGFLTNSTMRMVMMDHTFSFPRMIWYFALIAMGFMNYSFSNLLISAGIIQALYILSAYLYYINALSFLQGFRELRSYYRKLVWYVMFLPIYYLYAFFVRFAGIINSIKRKSTWKTKTFTDERQECRNTLQTDWSFIVNFRRKLINYLED